MLIVALVADSESEEGGWALDKHLEASATITGSVWVPLQAHPHARMCLFIGSQGIPVGAGDERNGKMARKGQTIDHVTTGTPGA